MLMHIFSIGFGQSLKTYTNKNYETGSGEIGTLTYTYYEDEQGNYVKHGKYNVNCSTVAEGWNKYAREYQKGKINYTATGNFKNGYLDGLLKITYAATSKSSSANNTTTTTLTLNFKNGMPHGNWKRVSYDNGKSNVEQYFSVNFTNGILTGSFVFGSDIKGQFNQNGEFDGKWIDHNAERNFINGIFISEIIRKDGEVVERTPIDETEIATDYANKLIDSVELYEMGYKMDTYEYKTTRTYWSIERWMKLILYEGVWDLYRIGGDKTLEKDYPNKVYGKDIYKLTKDRDVARLNDKDFEQYISLVDSILNNVFFENNPNKDITSANQLWISIYPTATQKERLTNLYNDYVNKLRPVKIEKIKEEERLEEERRIAEEKRLAEEKRKAIKESYCTLITTALDKLVDLSNDRAGMKLFGPEIVISADCNNNYKFWKKIFSSSHDLSDKLGTQLKDFFPIKNYTIDTVDIEQRVAYCTLEKYDKKEGSQYWQTPIYFTSSNIDLDRSFVFSKAIRIRGDWDVIRDLQKTIEEQKNLIEENSEKVFADISSSYNSRHKKFELKVVEDDLKATIAYLTEIVNIQKSYLTFIKLREQVSSKQNQILESCGKDFADVSKLFSAYIKKYDLTISADTTESYNRLQKLITIQDSCISFIKLRKTILDNDTKITSLKSAKNILKVYTTYMKSADKMWVAELNCCEKLLKTIDIQQQFLKVLESPNAKELDLKVKKLKDKSLDNVLKEIK